MKRISRPLTKYRAGLQGLLLACLACTAVACNDAPEQSDACGAYISCLQARDARLGITTNADRFEASGACWGGSEEGAHLCDTACSRGLDFLAVHETAPECQP